MEYKFKKLLKIVSKIRKDYIGKINIYVSAKIINE